MRPSSSTSNRDRAAAVTGLRHDDVDEERRAFENAARRADPVDLNVARQLRAADTDRVDGQLLRFHAEKRVGDRGIARVGAVGHEHDA